MTPSNLQVKAKLGMNDCRSRLSKLSRKRPCLSAGASRGRPRVSGMRGVMRRAVDTQPYTPSSRETLCHWPNPAIRTTDLSPDPDAGSSIRDRGPRKHQQLGRGANDLHLLGPPGGQLRVRPARHGHRRCRWQLRRRDFTVQLPGMTAPESETVSTVASGAPAVLRRKRLLLLSCLWWSVGAARAACKSNTALAVLQKQM